MIVILFLSILLASTIMYCYLHFKTRMNIKFVFIDNLIVAMCSFVISFMFYSYIFQFSNNWVQIICSLMIGGLLVVGLGYLLTMLRFWRTPNRMLTARPNEIVSPADGNVLYIKKIEAGETPVSIKNGQINSLTELTKTDLLDAPCWIVGINMTPWDVHKNCAPVDGRITLNKHTKGQFISLKKFESLVKNERNTYIIENDSLKVGVIQIASKGVRRIDSYVHENDFIKKGVWLGMIRFGSQVDVILPYDCNISIQVGQQVYAVKTVIASCKM